MCIVQDGMPRPTIMKFCMITCISILQTCYTLQRVTHARTTDMNLFVNNVSELEKENILYGKRVSPLRSTYWNQPNKLVTVSQKIQFF